jgi:hypothetical protein
MSDDELDPLDAALQKFRKREEELQRVAAERERAANSQARSKQENLSIWSTAAFHAISLGVQGFSDDFARQGSPFLVRQVHGAPLGSAHFEVHRSGGLRSEGDLKFVLQEDGRVWVATSLTFAKLPPAMAVDQVTAEWAKDAAKRVMVTVLDGQHR